MKNFKFFAVMLMSASFAGAMDPAGPATSDAAPLVDHDVCVITIGGKVRFTPEQLMKLDFLYGMLEEEAPAERGKDIDLREICVERPCLHYEGLHHIPTLVDCVTRADIDHYLSEISPEQACCAVLALHFLRAPQNVFAWAHAYIVGRLVNDNAFAVRCLSWSEARKNLEHIIMFCNNDSAPASIGSLRSMLLKNGLTTSTPYICSDAPNFLFSPDGSRLIVEREIDGHRHKVLHQTSDGSEIENTILGWGPVFSSDGSRLTVDREINGNWYVVLHQTSDGSKIGDPILGGCSVFSPDGSRLTVRREINGNMHVVLHQTSNGNEIGSPILGVNPVFSPDSSRLAVERVIDGKAHVILHRTSDGSKIGDPILGVNPVFSPDSSRLAITRKINDDAYVAALLQTSDGSEIGSPILGWRPVFSPDGSRLAVERIIDRIMRVVVLHRTSDCREIGNPILGYAPVFSPDGSRLAVRRWIDDNRHVVLYRTSDGNKIGNPILGYAPVFSPDGSLLKINFIIGGNTGQGLYFTDGDNALLQNVKDVQFGTNGTIAYQDGDRITYMCPIPMNPAEYLLTLAAIHQGSKIDETAWIETFDHAPAQLKAFVHAKTGKFIS